MGRAKKNILATHRQINKDRAKTVKANSPGGRYYVPSVVDKMPQRRYGKS